MRKHRLEDFTRGWIAGDFEPSVVRLKEAEFMVRYYKKGDSEPKHKHMKADEITVIISGKFMMNGTLLSSGDIIHLSPGEPADFKCIEDGANAVFKTPSAIGDKLIVN